MERVSWTDERLDDLAQRMDTGFAELRADLRTFRSEIRTEIGGVRGEIEALQQTILRVGGGMMVGLIGVIAAVLVRGA
ncbi:MAG: hypothetical protein M3383_09715 [Actinomycetota bacterium]|nr:hypothetical protein [Actinomycetota bacterium]